MLDIFPLRSIKYLQLEPSKLLVPVQQRHVQVAAGPPFALGHVLEPGVDEHEDGVPVREGAHDPRPALDLAAEPLDGAVAPDPPVFDNV